MLANFVTPLSAAAQSHSRYRMWTRRHPCLRGKRWQVFLHCSTCPATSATARGLTSVHPTTTLSQDAPRRTARP